MNQENAFKIWWMNDNHTFVPIRLGSSEISLCHIMECWEQDPWGTVCGYNRNSLPFEKFVPGCGSRHKMDFQQDVRRYVENIYRNGEP